MPGQLRKAPAMRLLCLSNRASSATSQWLALILSALVLGYAACISPAKAETLTFTPEIFFAGDSSSSGTIRTLIFWKQNFTARFRGEASPGLLRLDERFAFADGERLQRWELRRVSGSLYEGTVQTETGDGVLREKRPVSGRLLPAGAVLDYDGYAPGGGDTLFHFVHRMRAQADGTVANRVTISKVGLPVATARVTFAKTPEQLPPR